MCLKFAATVARITAPNQTETVRAEGKGASDTVIYDNAPGASEHIDAANPQPIANGSIVIHKGK